MVVDAAAAFGDLDRARRLTAQASAVASSITEPGEQVWALAAAANAIGAAGDFETARELVARAKPIASSMADLRSRVLAITILVEAVGAAGDLETARALAMCAERLASRREPTEEVDGREGSEEYTRHVSSSQSLNQVEHDAALVRLAEALVRAGDPNRAAEISQSIRHPAAMLWIGVTEPVALTGAFTEAEDYLLSVFEPEDRALGLAHLAVALAAAGDRDGAVRLAGHAAAAGVSTAPLYQDAVLFILAETMVRLGDLDRAEKLACSIPGPTRRAWTIAGVRAAVTNEDPDLPRIVAQALRVGSWNESRPVFASRQALKTPSHRRPHPSPAGGIAAPAGIVASPQPSALTALADELSILLTNYPAANEDHKYGRERSLPDA
jgi:hypothetical protein